MRYIHTTFIQTSKNSNYKDITDYNVPLCLIGVLISLMKWHQSKLSFRKKNIKSKLMQCLHKNNFFSFSWIRLMRSRWHNLVFVNEWSVIAINTKGHYLIFCIWTRFLSEEIFRNRSAFFFEQILFTLNIYNTSRFNNVVCKFQIND